MTLSNEKRKLLQRLRSPRQRSKEGLFLVEGVRGVQETLAATLTLEIRFALVAPSLQRVGGGAHLSSALSSGAFPLVEISDREMAEASDTEASQGVLLGVEEPKDPLGIMEGAEGPRILLLDGIQDPGNVGTLLRAAGAFGLDGALALDGTADPWNAKAVRAAAGAFGHLPVARLPWESARDWMAEKGMALVVADAKGDNVRGVRVGPPWALAIGNEGAGPRSELLDAAEAVVSIPMAHGVDSLNAGMAGAVLLYALTGVDVARRNDGGVN
jgi:TrmH family RNA methyltransferase